MGIRGSEDADAAAKAGLDDPITFSIVNLCQPVVR